MDRRTFTASGLLAGIALALGVKGTRADGAGPTPPPFETIDSGETQIDVFDPAGVGQFVNGKPRGWHRYRSFNFAYYDESGLVTDTGRFLREWIEDDGDAYRASEKGAWVDDTFDADPGRFLAPVSTPTNAR
jgi:hypothetical protein